MPEHVLAHTVPSKHKEAAPTWSACGVAGYLVGRLAIIVVVIGPVVPLQVASWPTGPSASTWSVGCSVRQHRPLLAARPICRWSQHRVPPPRPPPSRPASVGTCCLSLGCRTPAVVFLIPTADPPTLVGTLHRHFPPSPGLPTVPAPAWHSGPPSPKSVCVLAPPVPAPTPPAAPCTKPAGTLGTAPPRRPGCSGIPRLGLAGSRKTPCRLPTGWRPGPPQSQT